MTLHQLRVFVKVAEMQSFTEAARSLRLSQPSASALVQGLVGELRCKLFERRGAKTFLTQEGMVLLRHAKKALATIDATRDEIEEISGQRKGKIRVGGSALAAAWFLPVAVQRFKRKHAGVDLTLTIDRSSELQKKLLQGDLDVAILGRAPRFSQITAEPFRDVEVVAIASPKHPLAKRRSVSLELLAKEPLIAYGKGSTIRDLTEKGFAEKGFPFTPFLEVNFERSNRDAIKSVVVNGLGIGFTSKFYVASDIKAGRLRVLRVPDLHLKRTLYIAVHRSRQRSPLVQTFIDFLRQDGGRE